MSRLASVIVLLAFATGQMAAAPQERVEGPILSVRTDLVTLSVTVVDERGALVTDLRQEHFTVSDNGEARPIQFFTSEDRPATIGLLVDSSGSMAGRGGDVAAAAAAFAEMRHPLDEFFTVNFNERAWPGLPPNVAFTDDVEQLGAALVAAPAAGMTALYDALDRGLHHLQYGTRDRQALIIVSDGGDNASVQTFDVVLDHARQSDAVVYAVTLYDPDNRDARPAVLKALAHATGGRTFRPKRRREVHDSFVQIAREIRSVYRIGFAAAETREGGFRPIRVTAAAGDGRRLTARTRAGYYAEPARGMAR